jgi:hypothetical protein
MSHIAGIPAVPQYAILRTIMSQKYKNTNDNQNLCVYPKALQRKRAIQPI